MEIEGVVADTSGPLAGFTASPTPAAITARATKPRLAA